MDSSTYTFFVVNTRTGQTRKMSISISLLRLGTLLGLIAALIILAGTVDYVGLLLQSLENKRLKIENAQLKKQFQIVESKVDALDNSLERVKTFTTKLKIITNLDTEEKMVNLTKGTKPAAGQATEEFEAMDERASEEEIMQQEQPFVEEKPLNESRGEVASATSNKNYSTLVVRIDRAVKETQLREQSVIELWESLSERQSLLNSTPNIKPARGWLTSKFGYRMNPFTGKRSMHAGLDIAAAPGSPVYAPADGVVMFAAYDESYGKLVSIDHGYGVTTRFGHNSQVYVHVGQRVSKWDVISAVGNTGRSTGPHLHYEVRVNGTPVDPINYILDE
ncbi:MAG: M23 family metallopeptidase [Pseudobdellovibrionaceae bacterium]